MLKRRGSWFIGEFREAIVDSDRRFSSRPVGEHCTQGHL